VTLLAVQKISKKFKDQVILNEVSFTITDTDRVALVGRNGEGKTTLLEILAGKCQVDSGEVTCSRSCAVDYVEQEKSGYLDLTLFEFVAEARRDLLAMRQEIRRLEEELAVDPHDDGRLRRLGELQQDFERGGGFDLETEVGIILQGLGFESERYGERMSNFSGGEKNRAGLARILAGKGNLLLLDEPTNHLDIESTVWLEEYLSKLNKAYVIVSHDRAFLTATVDQVWELAGGQLDVYSGGFERYLGRRVDRRRLAEHHYRHQQEQIKRIEEFIRRNMAGQKTKQAQSRLKYLTRIKRLPPPRADLQGPAISVQSSGRSWAHVLAMEDVSLGYGSRIVLEEVGFDIYRGDKVGLIGRNGSGKSTLLRALIGELEPIQGRLALGNNVDVAYFDQELSDLADDATVLDNMWRVDPGAEAKTVRSFLARFGLSGDEVFKPVLALSGGEKTKLCLARLLYHPSNLLLLDEPTNHLDVYAREALESALKEYDGSCLVVSHDRYFLEQVADRIIYLDRGRAVVFNGKYSEFRDRMQTSQVSVKVKDDGQKRAWEDFKARSRERSRRRKAIESTRAKIATLERELERLEQAMSHDIPRHDWEELQRAANRRKQVENDILDLYAGLESLEGGEDD